MSNLGKRISGRVNMTVKSFRSDLHFSVSYALLRVGSELGGRLHLKTLSRKATEKKHRWVEAYLEKELEPVIRQYEQDTDIGQYKPEAPIWVCWWTGEETAPELVKRCIKSIRENANGHPVNLITQDNYGQYLEIPETILRKVEKKQMGLAHFADYIRLSLLAKYGGLWLDATIFCSQPLPEELFRMPMFTCKGRTGPGEYWSDYKWTVFCIGGYRGNVFFRILQESLRDYWESNQVAIDYLFLDYIIKLVYSNHEICGRLIDELPENNLHRDDLQAAMNQALPQEQWKEIIQPDTVLYKLSWREKYQEKTPTGGNTIYSYFIEQ